VSVLIEYLEHRIPPGSILVALKMCESCSRWFVREGKDRHCRKCHSSPIPLQPQTLSEVVAAIHAEVPLLQ